MGDPAASSFAIPSCSHRHRAPTATASRACSTRQVRPPEHVDDVDGTRRLDGGDDRRVAGQPVDLGLARVHGHDVVARRARSALHHAVGRPRRGCDDAPTTAIRGRNGAASRDRRRRRGGAPETGPPATAISVAQPVPVLASCCHAGVPSLSPSRSNVHACPDLRHIDTAHRCDSARTLRPCPAHSRGVPGITGGVHVAGFQAADRARRGIGHLHRGLFGRRHATPARRPRRRRVRGHRESSEAPSVRSRPSAAPSAARLNTDWKACVAFDTGGLGDKGFNDLAKKGLNDAKALGYQTAYSEAQGATDYARNIQTPHRRGLPVDHHGRLQPGAGHGRRRPRPTPTSRSRRSTPSGTRRPTAPRRPTSPAWTSRSTRRPRSRATSPPASARARCIGTYGGQQFPGVTRFMDGYVRRHRRSTTRSTARPSKLLGWDAAKQTGTFVGGDNPWGDPAKGEQLAKTFLDQGADIVDSGRGRARATARSRRCSRPTSRPSASTPTRRSRSPSTQGAPDLRTEGHRRRGARDLQEERRRRHRRRELRRHARQQAASALAPYHDLDRSIPADLKTEVDQLQGGHRLRHGQGRRLPQVAEPPDPDRTPPVPGSSGGGRTRIQRKPPVHAPRAQGHHEAVSRRPRQRPRSRSRLTAARSSACSARTAPARPP